MMWNGNVLIFRGWISHNFQRFIVGELLDGIECNYLFIFPQIISICEWSIPWTLCKSAMEVESISMCCIGYVIASTSTSMHGDVIQWKHFPRYWPFVREIHRSPANSPHKGQWHGALMFPLVCGWINDWANTRDAGDLRRHRAHYDVIVMLPV